MNNNRLLLEWIYTNTPTNNKLANEKLVYMWDIYINQKDKGTWLSAEEINGVWEGFVLESEADAISGGLRHLEELENEGELDGDLDDYTVDAIAVPISKVSKNTLRFSGL